ncbi:MAG: pitrilysin family protein [Planctomycetota bacterium]
MPLPRPLPSSRLPGAPTREPGAAGGGPPLLRDVHHEVLDNGLRVFLIQSNELPIVSHWIWYSVGSRDERTGETGLSHFLEHMMFKGTERFPKGSIDTTTARLGGNNNAMTSQDYTAYYFNLASDRWTAALEIEASRMQGCLLDEVEFGSEKKVVLEELAMGEDEPWRPLWQAVESAAFRVHPYHHPIIGWREDLERLDRDTMLGYYRRHYTPDRASLVLVGDLEVDAAMAAVREHMGPIPSSGRPRDAVLAEEPQKGERRVTVRFPGNLSRCAMCWHTTRTGTREDVVLDVASTLLSGGKASRLYKGLVQGRELASTAECYNETRLDPGLFWVLGEARPETDPADLERGLLEEVDRLVQDGPDEKELARAKKQILNGFFFSLETASSQAQRIGLSEVLAADGWAVLQRYPGELGGVEARDVQDVLARHIGEDNRTVGWSRPPRGDA